MENKCSAEHSIALLEALVRIRARTGEPIDRHVFKMWEEGLGLCFEDTDGAVQSGRHSADDDSCGMEVR